MREVSQRLLFPEAFPQETDLAICDLARKQTREARPHFPSRNHRVGSARQGDTEAFEPIYTNYFGLVHSICLRMLGDPVEAEDVPQDTFVHLLRKIHMFRGESAFSSWLYRLTTNLVLMRFRRRNRKLSSLDEFLDDEDEGSAYREIGGPDLHLAGLFDRINLQAAIDVLPEGYKAAFILHDVHGYEHRER